MLAATSVSADLEMEILGRDVMIKMLMMLKYQGNLKLFTQDVLSSMSRRLKAVYL